MSLVGELIFFLGLQVKQLNDENLICQCMSKKNLVKQFELETARQMNILKGTNVKLSKDVNIVDVTDDKNMQQGIERKPSKP